MSNVAFLVGTEYHLILTIGFIQKHFNNQDDKVSIYRISPVNSKRLNRLDRDELVRYNYKELFVDYLKSGYSLKDFLDAIINSRPTHFFFFLEDQFWIEYLISKLHKNNCKIILAQDGIKPYNDRTRPFKERFLDKLRYIKYSFKHHLNYPIGTPENHYATSKRIDEVWLEHPDYYVNHTNKQVKQFALPVDNGFVESLNKVFGFNSADYPYLKEETIVYFDSNEAYPEFLKKNVWLMSQLKEKHPDRKLLIKLHPSAVGKREDVYNTIGDVVYLDSKYPAELFMANCNDAIFVSLFSTAMFYYNDKCKYYWVYPLYQDIFNSSGMKVPCDHIQIIETERELKQV